MFEEVKREYRYHYNSPRLPKRKTEGSAGYDFYSLDSAIIGPNKSCIFWTDVKINLPEGYHLEIYPRSSVAINKHLVLYNTVGIIDSDYYENEDNDGNIAICLLNIGDENAEVRFGDRIAQGIIKKHYTFETVKENRSGGLGSTGS